MIKKHQNKLDKLWREAVIEWFGESCMICGKKNINVHHIVGRRNRATRWYIPNGAVLCPGCHTFNLKSAHQDPVWFLKNIEAIRGKEFKKALQEQSNKTFKGTFEQVESYLKSNHPEMGY